MNIQYRYFSLDKFLDDAVGNEVSNIELWGAMPFFNIEDMTYQEVKEVRHQIESSGLEKRFKSSMIKKKGKMEESMLWQEK